MSRIYNYILVMPYDPDDLYGDPIVAEINKFYRAEHGFECEAFARVNQFAGGTKVMTLSVYLGCLNYVPRHAVVGWFRDACALVYDRGIGHPEEFNDYVRGTILFCEDEDTNVLQKVDL